MSGLGGKRGLVLGVANERSLAWAIAHRAAEAGAHVAMTYAQPSLERRVRPLAEQIDAAPVLQCDVTDDAQLDATIRALELAWDGPLDFIVHAVASARREDLRDRFLHTSRQGFQEAMDVGVYSLIAVARRARPLMSRGGAIVTLSYFGAEKVIPGYDVMGVAKAALESAAQYLAVDLAPEGIRVNVVSAGPVRTLSAAAIPRFREMLKHAADRAPLKRNTRSDEIAETAMFLISDAASAITGETVHVDCGYHLMGA